MVLNTPLGRGSKPNTSYLTPPCRPSSQTILENKRLKHIKDGNKFYFLKVQVEGAIEAYIQQQLVARAAKKKHPPLVPKFECLLCFAEHQAPPSTR